MTNRLFIYGTSYNNANRIEQSLKSVKDLSPYKIYITDNYSNDGTYELLKKNKDVVVIREKCKRGEGRELALIRLLKDTKPSDCVLQIDFDVIYKKPYINYVKGKMKILKDDEVYADFGSLSTARTSSKLHWPNLNAYEEVPRLAAAVENGIRVYKLRVKSESYWNRFWDNEKVVGQIREARYERKNPIKRYIRFFVHVTDAQRGGAYKSFSDFFAISENKSTTYVLVYFFAYIAAKINGVYSFDKKLDNPKIVNSHVIYVN